MQAHNTSIKDFLSASKTVFIVPVYQRNYNWTEENCNRMFYDIKRSIEKNQDHFFGTIFFKKTGNTTRSIIDGQQRLTSITLMLKAMSDYTQDDSLKEEIKPYLYNTLRNDEDEEMKIKLHLNERDYETYKIILKNDYNCIENQLTKEQKKSQVYKNYCVLFQWISKYIEEENGKIDNILDFLSKLTIIELELQNENPHEIFESLNSTGLSLQKVDLLRNYFLMPFSNEQQKILYDEYWVQIENAIDVANMEQFFTEYLIYKRRSSIIKIYDKKTRISTNTLYTTFKHWYDEECNDIQNSNITEDEKKQKLFDKTQKLFSDLKKLASLYKELIFDDDIDLKTESYIRQKIYYLLKVNESSKASCLLLYFLNLHSENKIDDTILQKSIEAVLSFSVRAKLCKRKSIDYQFIAGILQKLQHKENKSEFLDALWNALTSGEGISHFPTDEEFKIALTQNNLYLTIKKSGIKYLLYALEEASKSAEQLPGYTDSSIAIEHIIPEKLTSQWKKSLSKEDIGKYEHYVHTLGNLALIDSTIKTEKKTFDEKKAIYSQSNYYYTQKLSDLSQYSIYSIERRGTELAQKALIIWNLPQKPEFQEKQRIYHSIYTLKDKRSFSGTKPNKLYIGVRDYNVTNWSDLLPILCKEMIAEDKSAFLEIVKSKKCKALVTEDDERLYNSIRYINLIDDIYIIINYSSNDILKIASNLLETFDQMTGSELFDSMAFTLKDN